MLISDATAHAFETVASRQRDVMRAFTPGATPERKDVAAAPQVTYTQDPLSATAPPGAFFVSRGDGRLLFSRDGSLSFREGVLVDGAGRAMLGYTSAGSALAELKIDRVDSALGLAASARIEADGSVVYDRVVIDPANAKKETQHVSIGKLALARFPAGTKPQSFDATHDAAPPGVVPHLGMPGDANFAPLRPHSRESGSISFDGSLQRLEEAYLSLDALRAAAKAQGSVQKTAMDLLT